MSVYANHLFKKWLMNPSVANKMPRIKKKTFLMHDLKNIYYGQTVDYP
jgi:hypothetical protein